MKEIILIIDDEPEDIRNFKDHIMELQTDYEVEAEEDFSETISKIEDILRRGDKIVATFIDLGKKERGVISYPGLNSIYAVKEKYNDILIVAYTQYGIEEIKKAYNSGAVWDVRKQELKDLTLEKLKNKINEHTKEIIGDRSQYKDWNIGFF